MSACTRPDRNLCRLRRTRGGERSVAFAANSGGSTSLSPLPWLAIVRWRCQQGFFRVKQRHVDARLIFVGIRHSLCTLFGLADRSVIPLGSTRSFVQCQTSRLSPRAEPRHDGDHFSELVPVQLRENVWLRSFHVVEYRSYTHWKITSRSHHTKRIMDK